MFTVVDLCPASSFRQSELAILKTFSAIKRQDRRRLLNAATLACVIVLCITSLSVTWHTVSEVARLLRKARKNTIFTDPPKLQWLSKHTIRDSSFRVFHMVDKESALTMITSCNAMRTDDGIHVQ